MQILRDKNSRMACFNRSSSCSQVKSPLFI